MSERYLEDYAVGQTFGSGRVRVDKGRIKAFAAEFDPQPFHLDEALAVGTFFRGLAATTPEKRKAERLPNVSRLSVSCVNPRSVWPA